MKSALFRGFSTEDLLGILDCLKPRVASYKKNEFITMAGENLTGVGIILSGEVAVTKENAAGNRIIIAVLKPGEMFGETAAFSGSAVWPATVLAQAVSTVLFLPPEKIVRGCEKACMSHHSLITNMLRTISDKALMLNQKVEYFLIKSIRGKISTYLLEQYQETGSSTFILPLNRNVLADFLNVSRPSLSREMCRMRDEGIIEFHRSSVYIKDAEAMRKMIE